MQTSKNESFADDSNNFLILEVQSISRLKKILDDFRKLSGLACNVDKSYIMRIGDDSGEISQEILDIGFPFTNEITILGFILRKMKQWWRLTMKKLELRSPISYASGNALT